MHSVYIKLSTRPLQFIPPFPPSALTHLSLKKERLCSKLLRITLEGQIQGKQAYGRPRTMLLDWLLKIEEGNISYEELKMSAQDRSRWSQWRWNLPYGRALHRECHSPGGDTAVALGDTALCTIFAHMCSDLGGVCALWLLLIAIRETRSTWWLRKEYDN